MTDARDPWSGLPGDRPLPPHLDPRGPRAAAPRIVQTPPAAPPPSRVARALSVLAGTLSVVLFAVATVGYVLYDRYDGQINRIPGLSTALPGLTKPPAAPRDAKNVLLVGSDSREGVGASFGKDEGQRSDTIILAHLFGDSDKAQLVSFPRDTYVTIPAYTDPVTGVQHAERKDKINSAMATGGPALLIATIEQLTRIRVDNYLQIDFAGFQQMVEELGGVEVCLLNDVQERDSKIDLKAGRQVVRGEQALAFVRQRKGLPNGDIDRIRRQQAFIASIARTALSSGTLLNPTKLNGFLDVATRAVDADDQLSGTELSALALRLRNFSAGGVTFKTVPISSANGTVGNLRYLVLLDEVKAEALFDALRRDEAPGSRKKARPTPTPAPTPSEPLVVAPQSVRVSVLNGAGVGGLGARAVADLTGAGFTVVGSPGNRGSGATATYVRYGPTRADSARTLAAAVPGSTLQADESLGSTVELVLGASYTGAVAVQAGGAPTPTPTASAGPEDEEPALSAAEAGCIN